MKKSIGILGGGQLAMMGLSAAKDLDLECRALVSSMDEPAAKEHPTRCLPLTSIEAFADSIEILTFESEFFDPATFNFIISKNPNIEAMPRSSDILRVSDKLEQKKLFAKLGIEQSRYWVLNKEDFNSTVEQALEASNGFCVLKWAKGGYDGKGNFFLRRNGDKPTTHDLENALAFCKEAWAKNAAVYAEEGIEFQSECAIVHAQSAFGDSEGPAHINYPVVETKQSKGICLETWGAKGSELDRSEVGTVARDAATLIAAHFPKLPVFAVEFFLTQEGRLLANEMAPRVHNSGHYTLLDVSRSQFHNWMRSLAGLPLEPWSQTQSFVMRNWLGGETEASSRQSELNQSEVQFIDYHKEHRPGRKLGHLSSWIGSNEDIEEIKQKLERLDPAFSNN